MPTIKSKITIPIPPSGNNPGFEADARKIAQQIHDELQTAITAIDVPVNRLTDVSSVQVITATLTNLVSNKLPVRQVLSGVITAKANELYLAAHGTSAAGPSFK